MNQLELNKIAMFCIRTHSLEVSKKISSILGQDATERGPDVGGPTLHYIHNMALFNVLLSINSLFTIKKPSEDEVDQFPDFAESIRPRFLDMVDSIKDFRPNKHDFNES